MVLLASTGVPFSADAVEQAAVLAAGRQVAVVTIARLHGSSFGLPNPGLMPTRSERAAQLEIVRAAIAALDRAGCPADGQVVVTRNPGKAIARSAAKRAVEHVLVMAPAQGRLRRFVEGDVVAAVRRRVRGTATVAPAAGVLPPRTASDSAGPPSR